MLDTIPTEEELDKLDSAELYEALSELVDQIEITKLSGSMAELVKSAQFKAALAALASARDEISMDWPEEKHSLSDLTDDEDDGERFDGLS